MSCMTFEHAPANKAQGARKYEAVGPKAACKGTGLLLSRRRTRVQGFWSQDGAQQRPRVHGFWFQAGARGTRFFVARRRAKAPEGTGLSVSSRRPRVHGFGSQDGAHKRPRVQGFWSQDGAQSRPRAHGLWRQDRKSARVYTVFDPSVTEGTRCLTSKLEISKGHSVFGPGRPRVARGGSKAARGYRVFDVQFKTSL